MGQYVGPRSEQLGLVAPGLKYNTGYGLKMGLQVGAATAGSFHGLHVSILCATSEYHSSMTVRACGYTLFEARGNSLGPQLWNCGQRVG